MRTSRERCVFFATVVATIIACSPSVAQDDLEQQRIDRAVVKALDYLARTQKTSGAWETEDRGESTAATSLAVMAYMAAGHVPGEGPYRERIDRAIRWVISRQKPDGVIIGRNPGHGPMYSHGICALMLAEVVGMVDDSLAAQCRTALERAITVIIDAQDQPKDRQHAGGWRYQPTSRDSDLSVTGWQLLALRAAKDIGCDVPAENIDRAVDYIKRLSVRGNRGFGYQSNNGATPVRAGTGILALEVCGEHHSDEALGATAFLLERPLRASDGYFYYGAYYCSIGVFKIGGEQWSILRPLLFAEILEQQNSDGSWRADNGSEKGAGAIYATSMAVLALAVEYRYLPIYQR